MLADFYERSTADLSPEVSLFIEDHMLTVSGFRDTVALDNALSFPGVTRDAIDLLVERRLVRCEDRGDSQRLELTHDLLAGIVRASRDNRHRREAAERERAELLASQEEQKQALLKAKEEERRQLDAAQERERRKRDRRDLRRFRIATVVFAVLTLAALGAAGSAIWNGKEAIKQKRFTESARIGQDATGAGATRKREGRGIVTVAVKLGQEKCTSSSRFGSNGSGIAAEGVYANR